MKGDPVYEMIMKAFEQLEQKMYYRLGKSQEDIRRMKREQKAKVKHRAEILKRQDSLVERQSVAVPLGAVPWWEQRQNSQWQSKIFINDVHLSNKRKSTLIS